MRDIPSQPHVARGRGPAIIDAEPDLASAVLALTTKYTARDFPTYMRDDWRALEAAIAKALTEQSEAMQHGNSGMNP